MKLVVLSDSHHRLGYMYEVLEKEMPDAVLHLGDFLSDAEELSYAAPEIDYFMVPGNCDHDFVTPPTIFPVMDSVPILMTHGHLFSVKRNTDALLEEAKQRGAAIACFGHTHRPYLEFREGVWLLNPGTCGAGTESYAVIETDNGNFHCELRK